MFNEWSKGVKSWDCMRYKREKRTPFEIQYGEKEK